jgi:hypothetical protein
MVGQRRLLPVRQTWHLCKRSMNKLSTAALIVQVSSELDDLPLRTKSHGYFWNYSALDVVCGAALIM